jgi:putative membrane protein
MNNLERPENNNFSNYQNYNNPRPESGGKRFLRFLFKLIVSSFAVLIASYFMPGVEVDNYITAIIVAFVLALLNALLKPILIILTIPVTVMSFGLFLLVINAFIIQTTAYFVDGFTVTGFWAALFFSILLSVVTWVLELPVKNRRNRTP